MPSSPHTAPPQRSGLGLEKRASETDEGEEAVATHSHESPSHCTLRFMLVPSLHPDWTLLLFFFHTHGTVTVTLALTFIPKVRSSPPGCKADPQPLCKGHCRSAAAAAPSLGQGEDDTLRVSLALINRDPKQRSHFREGRGRTLLSLCLQSLGKGSKSRVGGVLITQFEGWQTLKISSEAITEMWGN